MDPITALSIGSAVVKGASGIFGSIAGHNDAVAQARAQNQAMMDQYKYRLQIRDKQYKDTQQIYATKLGQYDLGMKAADRAAARAYGIEQYNQSQRLKQAAFQGMRLDRALAKSGGAAAAAGKSGRSAQRLDTNVENAFVRNQNMIAQNLLTAEETRQYRELGIADKLQSERNRLYSQVAIAPTKPMELLEPTQLAGPSSTGMGLGILNAGLGMATGIAGAFAPNVGGGGVPTPTPTPTDGSGVTPLTSGMNFF
jgi:hypothetical protein